MASVYQPASDDEYGSDTKCLNAWPKKRDQITGRLNLAYAIARRYITPRGALAAVGEDPNYGLDLRVLVNAALTPAQRSYWESLAAQEASKDERVLRATVSFDFTASTSTLAITVRLETNDDEAPFGFVVTIDALSITELQLVA